MKALSDSMPKLGVLSAAAIAFAFAFVACGGAKPPEAKSATPPSPAEPLGRANAQPSAPNTSTATNVAISEDILRACNIPDADAYFVFDSSRLTAFDHRPLDQVAICFTHGPMAGRHLSLVGHADPRGADDYNMTLGQSRADAVSGYLVTRGLHSQQESTTSRGALDATGRNETGWAHDRRVDLYLAR